MRYQVHRLQQEALIELGLNTEDALLLDWMLNWKDGNSMERIIVNNDDVWPITCYRAGKDASVTSSSRTQGLYWADNASTDFRARILYLTTDIKLYDSGRSNGIAVRCMVDTENR